MARADRPMRRLRSQRSGWVGTALDAPCCKDCDFSSPPMAEIQTETLPKRCNIFEFCSTACPSPSLDIKQEETMTDGSLGGETSCAAAAPAWLLRRPWVPWARWGEGGGGPVRAGQPAPHRARPWPSHRRHRSTNAPWHFENEAGELVGMDIAMAHILARASSTTRTPSSSSSRTRRRASRTSPRTRSTSSSSS